MPATAAPLDEVALLKQEVTLLRAQIEWFKKQLFGAGKSEKLDRAQLLLQLSELEKLAASAEAPKTETISYERTTSPAAKRTLPAESFAHLPVKETIVIEPESATSVMSESGSHEIARENGLVGFRHRARAEAARRKSLQLGERFFNRLRVCLAQTFITEGDREHGNRFRRAHLPVVECNASLAGALRQRLASSRIAIRSQRFKRSIFGSDCLPVKPQQLRSLAHPDARDLLAFRVVVICDQMPRQICSCGLELR